MKRCTSVMALVVVVTAACADRGWERGVRVAPPVEDPDQYLGARIALHGPIVEAVAPNAFVIAPLDGFVGERVLVISPQNLSTEAAPETEVRASGELRVLEPARLERELGIVLSRRVRAREGQRVLVAERLEPMPAAPPAVAVGALPEEEATAATPSAAEQVEQGSWVVQLLDLGNFLEAGLGDLSGN